MKELKEHVGILGEKTAVLMGMFEVVTEAAIG